MPFIGGLTVRAKRAGNVRWAAAQDDGDLAVQVKPRQIVVVQLGNGQAVTDEHQRCLGRRCRVNAHADNGVLAERERPCRAVAHQCQAGILLQDAARTNLDRL